MTEPAPRAAADNRSRREFIKTSSAVVGGAIAGSLSVARSAHAAGSDEIRIGLIGCGGRGVGAAGDTLSINKTGVKIAALGDAFSDRLESTYQSLKRSFGDRVDVPKDRQFVGFDAYRQVLDTGVDMVILATPPGFRPLHFEAAVQAGRHVFMEKPVAIDGAGVRRVLAAAKDAAEKKLGVGVGLQRRHEAPYIETIKKLQDGIIGDIVCTRVYWNGDGVWVRPRKPGQSEMEYQMRNWYYFNWLCGDHIVEQHIHNIDVSNWLLNAHPVKAIGMGGREVRRGKDHGEIFDHHAVEFTYANGVKMFSQCRHIPGTWSSVSEHAHGTKGSADINSHRIMVGNEKVRSRTRGINPYEQEHLDLVNSIRAGKPHNEAVYGAESTMTSILGRLATYSGREVSWEQGLNSQKALLPSSYTWDGKPPTSPDENGNYPVAVPGKWWEI